MLEKIQNHLSENFPFLKEKKLLLAASGGIDSIVMLHLFQVLNYNISIAHCNFQLRGLESFEDEKFLQQYALKCNIPIFSTHFDTENFAKDHKLSIQVAARNLRYDWFYELINNESFDFILTAHHADDNLETFFINLIRCTGLDGLTGIPQQNGKIIRPLLPFSRQEIEVYAKKNNLKWREDSSNATTKYIRNKIRHDLIPVLKELNPNFLESFLKTQFYLQKSQELSHDAVCMMYQNVANEADNNIYFDIDKLIKLDNYTTYLYYFLKDYNFKAWDDIFNLIHSESGKIIYSDTFKLIKNRKHLILSKIENLESFESLEYLIEKNISEVKIPINLSFNQVKEITTTNQNSIFVDENKLQFPLILRKYKTGDVFCPSGMNGKSKKVSKFFKDEKLSIIEKQKTWILTSNDNIICIIGHRPDERFKATIETRSILQIKLK